MSYVFRHEALHWVEHYSSTVGRYMSLLEILAIEHFEESERVGLLTGETRHARALAIRAGELIMKATYLAFASEVCAELGNCAMQFSPEFRGMLIEEVCVTSERMNQGRLSEEFVEQEVNRLSAGTTLSGHYADAQKIAEELLVAGWSKDDVVRLGLVAREVDLSGIDVYGSSVSEFVEWVKQNAPVAHCDYRLQQIRDGKSLASAIEETVEGDENRLRHINTIWQDPRLPQSLLARHAQLRFQTVYQPLRISLRHGRSGTLAFFTPAEMPEADRVVHIRRQLHVAQTIAKVDDMLPKEWRRLPAEVRRTILATFSGGGYLVRRRLRKTYHFYEESPPSWGFPVEQ